MPRISERKIEQVLELFSQGLSIGEIARQTKLSEKTVMKILKNHGLSGEGVEAMELQDKEEKLTEAIQNTMERTTTAVINRVVKSLTEAYVKTGIAMGLEMMDKYKWVAKSMGYEKTDEFIENAINFYLNYYPVVYHMYDKLDLIEKIYLATLTALYKIYWLLYYIYFSLLSKIVDLMKEGKMDERDAVNLIIEILKFTHDAITRITSRPISEIIGESETGRSTTSRHTNGSSGESRENNTERRDSEAHDDSSSRRD
jgi:Helix-turn-helix domain of resolvase.